MKCGRHLGGDNLEELGICPAAVEKRADGINEGLNGGRSCWGITGTLCNGQVEGRFAAKVENCLLCEFYKLVSKEQGDNFQGAAHILAKLKKKA